MKHTCLVRKLLNTVHLVLTSFSAHPFCHQESSCFQTHPGSGRTERSLTDVASPPDKPAEKPSMVTFMCLFSCVYFDA